MTEIANVSGAFMRPTLIDYLLVAEQQRLRVGLLVHLGRLELGLVGVEAGQVVFAELPGSDGDVALSLLTRVPGARVEPQAWTDRAANLERSWRELVDAGELEVAPGRAWRLDAVRAELAEVAEVEREADPDPATEVDPRLVELIGELLDWAAADACLAGDGETAQELLRAHERLDPADLVCAANLERLHLRLLEDEIAASVSERSA